VYHLLADDESRETYKAVIKFRRNLDFREIKPHIYYPQYFVKGIINCQKEIFVDGGAYIGDSIFALLKYATAEEIKKIYAWEPDKENGKALSRNLDRIQKKNTVTVEWIPCALYKEKSTLKFISMAGQGSQIGEGDVSVPADTIDHRCTDATFIKMDLEGAEIDALYGAKNTIIQNKPKLAISIYHTNEHLYEIPLLIHEWVPEYKLYVRHHSDTCVDTILYAVVS
jgi:FkbM family methyltransferase